jgi:hypothetical protein
MAGETDVFGEKPEPVPLCPPQIPHGLLSSLVCTFLNKPWPPLRQTHILLYCSSPASTSSLSAIANHSLHLPDTSIQAFPFLAYFPYFEKIKVGL